MTRPDPLAYNPEEPQYPQEEDWTCSACSLAWANRALLIDYATNEFSAVEYIGEPTHINSSYGLMDASGARLVQCLREQGAPAFNAWLDWDDAYHLAQNFPLLIGGVYWNHWVGVRFSDGDLLHLANSAPGWAGVNQSMNTAQWYDLGPFAVVGIPLLQVPPPPRRQPNELGRGVKGRPPAAAKRFHPLTP